MPNFAILWTVAHQAPLSMAFLGKNTRVGCYFLFQGIFLTQGSNLGLLHHRQILYHLSHHESFFGPISSVAQSSPTLCDPMNCSTPGLPVHHQLPESTQTPCPLSW